MKAGIKAGDVIVAVNGERIANARELAAPHRLDGAWQRGQADRAAGWLGEDRHLTLGELPAQARPQPSRW